jgi:hypothetical protein
MFLHCSIAQSGGGKISISPMPGLTLRSKIIYQELKLYSWKFNKTLRLHITGTKTFKALSH